MPTDYSIPANVTFDSGDTSATFTFSATQDTVDDDGESVLTGLRDAADGSERRGARATSDRGHHGQRRP